MGKSWKIHHIGYLRSDLREEEKWTQEFNKKKSKKCRKRNTSRIEHFVFVWDTGYIVWIVHYWRAFERWRNECNISGIDGSSMYSIFQTARCLNFITTSFLIISRTQCSFLPPKWFYGSWKLRIFISEASSHRRRNICSKVFNAVTVTFSTL